ncbi:TIGR02452 family protein [Streptomyces sp. RFCAC02]|uniref:TIGR02452 family protein n=1 Tax=Streptomyces sp. RFCAC02 TaxID=2499143 RepID=UPI0010227027|nr:TIGR02452 family protein [Streptomyces sp. RFCAC02]
MRERFAETRAAFERGWYVHEGRRVDLSAPLALMRAGVRLHLPDELRALPVPDAPRHRTSVEVTDESTLRAARRLAAATPPGAPTVAALNFASARNPGGGVLNGARSQEEDLARAGALYDALVRCPEFYAFHRAQRDVLYSDRLIYAPDVPVYRDDGGGWLPAPVPVAFLTAAAPNRRMLERDRPGDLPLVPDVLASRGRAVLAAAAHHGHTRLVLGAWGCGVFGNEPAVVAGMFARLLRGEFAGVFEQVVFAVLDRRGDTRRAFHEILAPLGAP